jgi:peptidoglycan/xylan/chitin deacetylase (PgdA/CDA1 family)
MAPAVNAAKYPVILTYHSISDGHSPLKISPSLFGRQMEWISANANVVSLQELVAAMTARRALPERTVVLTFDDAYRDFYSAAAPVLRQLRLPATIFLPTGFCGGTNSWTGQPSSTASEYLLGWQQIVELADQGFTFGAHTVTHQILTDLAADQVEAELAISKSQLEEHIGQPVEFFAYPFGRWNTAVRNIVKNHYVGACTTGAGVVEDDADVFALPRADAHYIRNPARLRALFTTPFLAYIAARRFIRMVRGKPEGRYARVRTVQHSSKL